MKEKQYLTEDREMKIREIFRDQKKKYNISELATSKIQGLTGINAYVFKEVLSAMEKDKKIEISQIIGKKVYWRLT